MDAPNSEAVCLKMDLLEERKENKIKDKEDCNTYGVAYVPPSLASSTRQLMVDSIRNEKNRLQMENIRGQLTPEEKELTRAKDQKQKATEVKTPEETELTRAKDQKRKAIEVKTTEEKKQTPKSNTASQRHSRGSKMEYKKKPNSLQQQQAFKNQPTVPKSKPHDNNIAKGPEVEIEELIKKAIATVTQTDRGNNKHQASVCLVCDHLIIGIERIHALNKERVIMHKHRLYVKIYEAFYNGDKLNPILVEQYNVEGLPGPLLSPRSFKRHDGHFECC